MAPPSLPVPHRARQRAFPRLSPCVTLPSRVPQPTTSAPRDPRITEHRNPHTAEIDRASPLEIVDLIAAEDARVAPAVAAQREQLARAIEAAEAALRAGGRVIYAGAGTSGRLGVLDASEIPPTFGAPFDLFVGLIAGGPPALLRAQEGAEDSPEGGAADVRGVHVSDRDFVVGIAASGTTPYVHGALHAAKAAGARTALVCCTPPPATILEVVDVAIVLITGPEVVTGSTRLKAGTATKLALNTISTGAMIRLGKTYGNLMVDLRATNAKLVDRSERIVAEVTGLDREGARALLARADGQVKRALVMQLLSLDAEGADRALAGAGGVIRRLLDAPPAVDA